MTKQKINEMFKSKNIVIENNIGLATELHKYVMDDETILAVIDSSELAILTNRRIFVLYKGFLTGIQIEEYQLKDVTSVEVNPGFLLTKIKITAGFNNKEVTALSREGALKFKNDISFAQRELNNSNSAPKVDVVTQLEKLAELKSKGILTEEEFTQQKLKLLS